MVKRLRTIAEARERRGLTQVEAAPQIPCERAQLSRIENGHVQAPSLRILAGMARLYRISLDEAHRLVQATVAEAEKEHATA